MQPYTYIIAWTIQNKFYYGAQWNKNANPLDLWKTYFTSSKIVKQYRNLFGEPDIVQIRKVFSCPEKCKHWESKGIDKFIKYPSCLNVYNNFKGKQPDSTNMVTVKDNQGNTFMTPIDNPLYQSGELKHINYGTTIIIDEFGNHIRVKTTDEKFLSGIYISINKGKLMPSQKSKIWVNNNSTHTLIYPDQLSKYIDNGFKQGKLKQKPCTRNYTIETNSQLGTVWINHELIGTKKCKFNDLPLYIEQGWVKGRSK